MDRLRLEYAAERFLGVMRREFVRLNPGAVAPAMTLRDFPPDHRSSLMKALTDAINATGSAADGDYTNWLIDRKPS